MKKIFVGALAVTGLLLTGCSSGDADPVRADSTTGANLYDSCADAVAAGAAPLREGDPGYRLSWDRDNDGVACEVDAAAAPSTSSKTPEFDAVEYQAQIERALLAGAGLDSFTAACPDISWLCTISDIEARNSSIIVITQQVTEADEELGRKTVIGVKNFIGEQFPDLGWVQVNNATGTVLANESI
ncbi:excalibur calcium-binding domain-containing protein [Rhodococcus sp. IEGM 1366]|uniref:excalibur calcium-binding domain-containing protein n=1 Tax=Rhodococcus sp. IEGM 1366 TaxID=3082223 RepID=UPI0029557D05|nr:excalibur calcium-binding domain-containing protein [Rhodococcus sp. IEGM 1366]MDV8066374.1 excalibur calcium-binding domain-containing protein [Rhodococcus sp. IEGM 1366]